MKKAKMKKKQRRRVKLPSLIWSMGIKSKKFRIRKRYSPLLCFYEKL